MKKFILLISIFPLALFSKDMKVNKNFGTPGKTINFKGTPQKLYAGDIKVGDNFVEIAKKAGLPLKYNNKVTIVSIVPSVDTKVCEAQTHILGERGLPASIDLVTISRDLPMAQNRFAKEAKLTNINYYSDYKYGSFGKLTGLLIKGKELLARSVMVLNSKGVITYFQMVTELTQLPDMEKAFTEAKKLK